MKFKKLLLITGSFLTIASIQIAQADVLTNYNVVETFYEPMTQPNNSIFTGSFTFDSTTKTISNLTGKLSESMTGDGVNPATMSLVPLTYQLSAKSDGQGGELVTTFALNTTNTFKGGVYAPGNMLTYGNSNAYAMIDVNLSNPTAALTTGQINLLAYADCTPGGMMGKACMTGTTVAGYGTLGSMAGYPVSETITRVSPVPEPTEGALLLSGLGLLGFISARRKSV